MSARREAWPTVAACVALAVLALFASGCARIYAAPVGGGVTIGQYGLEVYGYPGFFDCGSHDEGGC